MACERISVCIDATMDVRITTITFLFVYIYIPCLVVKASRWLYIFVCEGGKCHQWSSSAIAHWPLSAVDKQILIVHSIKLITRIWLMCKVACLGGYRLGDGLLVDSWESLVGRQLEPLKRSIKLLRAHHIVQSIEHDSIHSSKRSTGCP